MRSFPKSKHVFPHGPKFEISSDAKNDKMNFRFHVYFREINVENVKN